MVGLGCYKWYQSQSLVLMRGSVSFGLVWMFVGLARNPMESNKDVVPTCEKVFVTSHIG